MKQTTNGETNTMAFNVKNFGKTSRLAPQEETDDIVTCDNDCCCQPSGNKNIVATQSWVKKFLGKFGEWTRFFKTDALEVDGGVRASRIATDELQATDLYATSITLVDPNGVPRRFYLDENGDLQQQYEYKCLFACPKDCKVLNYIYRYPNIAQNFIGLSPYQTMLNFKPLESDVNAEYNGETCPRVCVADGKEASIGKTLLFQCGTGKKITEFKIVDANGTTTKEFNFEVDNVNKVAINLPRFKKYSMSGFDMGEYAYVSLPKCACGGEYGMPDPFMPQYEPPFSPIGNLPPFPGTQASPLTTNIFDDNGIGSGSDIFDDIDSTEEDQPIVPQPEEVKYVPEQCDYSTATYQNFYITRDMVQKNVEQFMMVEIANA